MAHIGVIADTHGLIRPGALEALAGSDTIIHAGDVGSPEVLAALARIAPVHAIRGNIDTHPWAEELPEILQIELLGFRLLVLHDRKQLLINPAAEGYHCVISGHSHKAVNELREGVLYLNPGSAGPSRFRLPVTIGKLYTHENTLKGEIVRLR